MSGGLGLSDQLQSALNIQLSAWAKRFGPQFVLGLSGGGDSMALALGCATWMRLQQGHVHAVCVDHGLRDDAAKEAQQTVKWAHELGLTAETTPLYLQRGQSRLQERARDGRHRALVEAAKAHSARIILLAHNLNDQNETVALRLAAQTGLDGLAGISGLSASPFYRDDWPCLIGRPLLQVSRKKLRHDLVQANQDWHEDPSNANPAFARIRARSRLLDLTLAGAEQATLSRIASHAARLRQINDQAARALLERATLKISPSGIHLSWEALFDAPSFLVERALGWLAIAVGGAQRAPDLTKLTRLVQAAQQPAFKGATLAGTKFTRSSSDLIVTTAPMRKGQSQSQRQEKTDIRLRLHAISGNLDQFVTYLG
jgi:tRNA(Ile)-lysidine synthase